MNNEKSVEMRKGSRQIEEVISEMLKENTGTHFLDSGGCCGRRWQKNAKREFSEEESAILDVYTDKYVITYNTYHYLTNFLSITEESEALNAELQKIVTNSENAYGEDIEVFVKGLGDKYDLRGSAYTYNEDTLLSQDIVYHIVEDDDGGCYIILQTHNGSDARGGFTCPQVFYLGEEDIFTYFIIAQHEANASCDKCKMLWGSQDCGYNWYGDGTCLPVLAVGVAEEQDLKTHIVEGHVKHKNCGGTISFGVMEDY